MLDAVVIEHEFRESFDNFHQEQIANNDWCSALLRHHWRTWQR
jgi:hypothetical protein